MTRHDRLRRRRGNTLLLTVLLLVPMFAFVAMAIDLGLVALAQTQCQNAADLAAMTGLRSLNGNAQNNYGKALAPTNATNAAGQNFILAGAIPASQVQITLGSYSYDPNQQKFVQSLTVPAGQSPTLVQSQVSFTGQYAFARVLGLSGFNTTATSQAVYRPRDVSIVLDFSGSMNNESDLWNCESYLGGYQNSSNNLEGVYPLFGHYSGSSGLQQTNTNTLVGNCNVTTSVSGMPPLVNDYVSSNRGAQSPTSAFSSAPDAYAAAPAGDNFLLSNNNSGPAYATNVKDITGGTSRNANFETQGYKNYTGVALNGYTQGPRYWGKTFFVWPPDPTNDWRKKFFIDASSGQPLSDNTKLYSSSGNMLLPGSSTYFINYAAILNWIVNTGPNPFPTQLRAPRLTYYSSIPTDVPASAYDPTQPNSAITDPSQRFWKEYIDFTLGAWRAPTGSVQTPGNPSCSYGPDYTWGSVQINSPPGGGQYMNYSDNPKRPRHRFWFGPMTLVQYAADTGIVPGTAHDVSMFAAKIGIQAALQDIQTNHPNDLVAMILFSRPSFNGEAPECGAFSNAQYSMGNDYNTMMNGLWYAPNTTSTDATPWDPNGLQCPRSHGDYDGNTTSNYGFMLAHNQFYSNSASSQATSGGGGRKGANRLVIFETDGMANTSADYSGTWNGSYYNIGTGPIGLSGAAADQAVYACVSRLVAQESSGGFSTPSKPVVIQCLAFGAIFEPDAPASSRNPGVTLLQNISTMGNSVFPSSASDPTNGYKWVIGDLNTRQALLQKAFQNIMQSTIGVSLIQ